LDPKCAVFQEETFGPLVAILAVANEQQALAVAQQSQFGLGGAVFTQDVARGWRIAREELKSGSCAVNTYVQSHPEMPFGGIKDSRYGRELGKMALLEFANMK